MIEVAPGPLASTLQDGFRAWKGVDWDAMNLLYQRGWILDPRSKNKSVVLTESGLEMAQAMLMKHFGRDGTCTTLR